MKAHQLERAGAHVPHEIPVILDAKRGDTPQTMLAYARAIFDDLGADAVTVNPYLGRDSLEPFFDYADKGVFVVCKTSNPGAGEIQDLVVEGAEPLFVRVAQRAMTWDKHGTLGLVVGARLVKATVPIAWRWTSWLTCG